MNYLKSPLFFFALLVAFGLTFTACDDDEDTTTTPTTSMTELAMEVDYKVGDQEFTPGEVYQINGTAVSFDIAHFYVGGITLMPEEGDAISLDDKYLLVKPGEGEYVLAEVESGHYEMINFFVGVDPTTNSQSEADFTSRPSDDPLGMQDPSMHWGWNSGYRFIRIDGQVDTDGDGTPETLMQFHTGTNDFLNNFTFEMHKDIEGDHAHMELEVDFEKLFEGIDLSTEYITHVADHLELAQKFNANVPNAISMEHE